MMEIGRGVSIAALVVAIVSIFIPIYGLYLVIIGTVLAIASALYGERPFAADALDKLIEAVAAGRLRDSSQRARVPAWLRKVVLRGLATRREDRFPSMDRLQRQPRRRLQSAESGGAKHQRHRRRRLRGADRCQSERPALLIRLNGSVYEL